MRVVRSRLFFGPDRRIEFPGFAKMRAQFRDFHAATQGRDCACRIAMSDIRGSSRRKKFSDETPRSRQAYDNWRTRDDSHFLRAQIRRGEADD